MERFNKDGRWMIPLPDRKKTEYPEKEIRFIIKEAYCPKGCSIIDNENLINEYPGLRIAFKREGEEGVLVLSAIEGDFTKEIISGELKDGVKDDLYCPHCGVMFAKLVNCNCNPDADLVIIGFTSKLDVNNAVTFCNVTGCSNGAFMDSGEILRHIRLEESQ